MECLFCRIAAKNIPSEVIFEDSKTVAFLDAHPKAPGHTVVIPKNHSENIIELPKNEIGPLFKSVQFVVSKLSHTLKPNGFTIGINHGKVSGQAIDHLHVHIIPRFLNDGGSSIHSVVDNLPKESLREIAQRINQ